ncbi:MAG: hypothetical protein WBA53_10085 [Burkholderiaceae bacterium]
MIIRSAAGRRGASASLIAFAAVALALGFLVYMTDRAPGSAALLPWAGVHSTAPLLGSVGGWLPSFTHVFAFALLTAATARPSIAPPYWACMLWWAIDVAFEVAQSPAWKEPVIDSARRWLGDGWLTSLVTRYVERGTFDPGDLVAVTAGSLAAAAMLVRFWCPGDRHDR